MKRTIIIENISDSEWKYYWNLPEQSRIEAIKRKYPNRVKILEFNK